MGAAASLQVRSSVHIEFGSIKGPHLGYSGGPEGQHPSHRASCTQQACCCSMCLYSSPTCMPSWNETL